MMHIERNSSRRTTPKLIYHRQKTRKHTHAHTHARIHIFALRRYPSVKNSEGVVLWTHEIGSGLVAPDANNRAPEAGHGPANDADTDDGVEVSFVAPRQLDRPRTCMKECDGDILVFSLLSWARWRKPIMLW